MVITSDEGKIEDVHFGGLNSKSIKSNIYLATVLKVEPSLQAAFVDYGGGKAGFLPFAEIHPIYYSNTKPVSEILQFNSEKRTADGESEDVSGPDDQLIADIDKIEFNLEPQSDSDEAMDTFPVEKSQKDKVKTSIQNVISNGQQLLVQVFRDERGNKGVSLTTYITLPTRYCVFTPNNPKLHGVSRRIPDYAERQRLRDIIAKFDINAAAGLVVRTAACGASENDLQLDYVSAINHWNLILDKAKAEKVGLVDMAEGGVIQSIMGFSLPNPRVIVDNSEIAEEIIKSADRIGVEKNSIIVYRERQPLFEKFNVNEQINNLYKERVDLKSGGYLIINHTEALVAIDVNSGKLIHEKDIEHTAFKTNIEAAEEVCRQLKLRDIGGLIVVDFIDMTEAKNRRAVEEKMKNILSLGDRARVQFTAISPFGLMEISRQRIRTSFIDSSTIKCNHCLGTGRMFLVEVVLDEILMSLGNLFNDKHYSNIEVRVGEAVMNRYAGYNQDAVLALQNKHNTKIYFMVDPEVKYDHFKIMASAQGEGLKEVMKFAGLRIDDNNGGVNGWHGRDKRVVHQVKPEKSKDSADGLLGKLVKFIKSFFAKPKKQPEKPHAKKFEKRNTSYNDKRYPRKSSNGGKKYGKYAHKK